MPPAAEIHQLTAIELAEAYRASELSPVEAARALLDRIDQLDDPINAFCFLDPDETLHQAHASEERYAAGKPLGPLDGVPVAVKDLFLTQGWPTLKGSHLVDPEQSWGVDAPSVARLREAGACSVRVGR